MGKRKVCSDKKNPFDFKVNRQKHNVLGRKIPGSHGNPTVSCGLAQLKRKTILKKKGKLNRANKFLDQRFEDSSLSKEETTVLRLIRQRQSKLKKNIFNLNDEESLTHLGQSLDQIEDYNKQRIESDDDDEPLNAEFVRQAHFGGFSGENSERTQKEILSQLIAESKIKNHEKKMEKQKNIDLTEKLDGEWKDLQVTFKGGKKSDPPLVNDIYDRTVQELKFEARATPSKRLISEGEIAGKENEKRAKLESERMRRMVDEQDNKLKAIDHLSADSIYDGMILEENLSEDEKQNATSEEDGDDDDSEGYQSDHSDKILERKESHPSFKLYEFQKVLNSGTETYSENDLQRLQSMIKECVNKKSGEDIFEILLTQLFDLCKKTTINRELITMLFQQLYDIAEKSPIQTAYKILNRLDEEQKIFQTSTECKGKNILKFETLVLLNLCSYLYSTSDFRHPVITPAALFMSDIICKTSKKSAYNLIALLFISKLFLKWVTFSKRIVPEAISFLNDILYKIQTVKVQNVEEKPSPLNLFLLAEKDNINVNNTTILSTAIEQLHCYAEIYSQVPSFSEIFCKTQKLCKELSKNYQPIVFKLIEKLNMKNSFVRRTVTFPYTKPKPLKMFEPLFESKFSIQDDNKRRIRLSKSVSQKIRREEKSLLREVRQDTRILAAEKLKQQMLLDEERNFKVKQIYQQLASQEGEYKKSFKKKH